MQCAPVELTPWMDLERHRGTLALLNKNSRHGSRMCICVPPHTTCLLNCRRCYDDLTPHLLWKEVLNAVEVYYRALLSNFLVEATHGRVARVGACLHAPALAAGEIKRVADFTPRTA